jgi:2-hydroxychromene-2-carboxylate isomerase
MSLKTWVVSRIAEHVTSERTLNRARAAVEAERRAAGAPHVVTYFHQADDPYSQVTAQLLAAFAARYDVTLQVHLCSSPPDWAAPDRDRLIAYARRDAACLAHKAGISFADPGAQPDPARVAAAEGLLAGAIQAGHFIEQAAHIGRALWSGAALPDGPAGDAPALKANGDATRAKLGHYLGAMVHYGGEWYWGVDRLHYLEARLAGLGAGAPQPPLYAQPITPRDDAAGGPPTPLEFFLSFRSPYTHIVAERTKALADAYGAPIAMRFVLPMVMRGLPVPPAKSRYITMDTAREARRLGIAFGRVADPVGRPVERGYALLPWAMAQGRGYDFFLSFMRGVWAEGVDAGSDAGLRRIVERAGLSWAQAKPLIGNDDWRPEAEANRQALLALGLWGVPCFRYGDVSVWGQDRLWVIEDAMRADRGLPL